MTATAAPRARRRAAAVGFPDPRAAGSRQAARLPRQRRHQPEAARGDRGGHPSSTLPSNANIHRGVHYLSERATRGLRRRPGAGRALPQRRVADEIVFTRGTTEGINLVAQSWGRSTLGPGDEDPDHRDGAPLEHRSLAAPRGADWRDAARSADHRRGRARPRRVRPAAQPTAHGCSPSRTSPTRWARSTRCADGIARARARGRHAGGRRPVGAAPAGGRPGARLRLLRLLRATRCSGRPVSACSTGGATLLERDAAMARRRET